jgi:hypothetical protein
MDGRELDDEGDVNDAIVNDNGFVKLWDMREFGLTMLDGTIRMGELAKPSDEVANGDKDDDKEIEDVTDPNDVIVDDNGFVRQFALKSDIKPVFAVQLDQEISVLPSDEVANGDANENRDLEDVNDPNDNIVDDNGFVRQFVWAQTG